MRVLLFLTLALASCGGRRVQKFLAPDAWVLADAPTGRLARVTYDAGWRDAEERPWAPEIIEADGRRFLGAEVVTSRGWLKIEPLVPDATLSLALRHRGLVPHDFLPITTVTGGLSGAIPNEVRPVERALDETRVLPLHQLHNVYNDYAFLDGDLLLVTVDAPGADPERYLFRTRRVGLRTKAGVGFLVRTPLPWDEPAPLTPAFAATLAVGYRYATRQPTLRWAGDKLGLVASLGVGSTALALPDGDVDQQLGSVLNAALAGGGLELYDILSVQMLANLSSLWRDREESRATLAVGFDAVQFSRFTRDAGRRLFSTNALDRGADPDPASRRRRVSPGAGHNP